MLTKITIAAMLFTTPVLAQPQQDKCELLSQVAGVIMKHRQDYQPLPEVLKLVDQVFKDDAVVADAFKNITKIYYSSPAKNTDANKAMVIKKAQNEFYLVCVGL